MNDKDLMHLAAIVRDSDDAIIGKTLEGIITSWNVGAERIYGYTAEEAIGRTVAMLVPPDREDELPKILQKLTRGENINHYDTLQVAKDGRLVNISLTISPIRDASGSIIGASSIGRDMTKQKEAEDALRESARAYKLLMEQASDAILVSYPDQPLIEVNQRATDLFGYTREELLQLRRDNNAQAEGVYVLPLQVGEIMTGDVVYAEYPVQRKDGTIITAEFSARRLDDGRIVTIARDITERKRSEEALQQSEKRFRALIEHNADAIILSNAEGTVLYASPSASQILGTPLIELVGQNGFTAMHPDDVARSAGLHEELLKNPGVPMQFEARFQHRDKSWHWIEGTATNLLNEPAVRAIVSNYRDCTDRRHSEDTVRNSEMRYRTLIEQASDAIFTTDHEGNFLDVNSKALEMLGYSRDELFQLHVRDIMSKEDQDKIAGQWAETLYAGETLVVERRFRRKDGSHFYAESSSKMLDDGRLQAIVRDITERKRSEEQILFQAQILDQVQAAVVATDMEGIITHWNRHAETLYGWQRKEAMGQTIRTLMVGSQDTTLANEIMTQVMDEGWWEGEFTVHHKDGSAFPAYVVDSVIRDRAGQSIGVAGISSDITERKLAEETLRASEEKFRSIFDNTLDAMFITDREGTFVDLNAAAAALIGLPAEDLIGRSYADFQNWKPTIDLGSIRDQITDGGQARGDIRFVGANGVARDVEFFSVPNFIPGYHLSVAHDLTERRQAEQAITFERYLLNSLMDSTPDSIYFKDLEGKFTRINRALAQSIGLTSPAEATGKSDADFFSKELAHVAYNDEQEIMRTGEAILAKEEREVWPDGHETWVLTTKMPLRDTEGQITGTFGVSREITAQKAVEENLRGSEARFRLMFDSNPLPMWVFDQESLRFLEVNEAATARYGYTRDEFLSMRITDIRPSEEMPRLFEHLAQSRPALQASGEWRHQTKDGELIVVQITSHTFAFDKDDQSKPAILVVAEDITERKKAEETRLAKETAERANHAKSEFLSRMSHELRTPLNAILGFGELLQMEVTAPEQLESIGYIRKAGQHLLHLINEVLDIARIEEGKLTLSMEPVFVRDVLQASLELMMPLAANRNVNIEVDLEGMDSCFVMADRQRLQQILLNLIANAIKYNREGGTVAIVCSEAHSDLGDQSPQPPGHPDRIRIEVRDTGHGLSPEQVERLFKPFERLGAEQGAVEGTGLGLAISKHLVEAMDGAIGVKSEEGTGSIFWLELALVTEQMSQFEVLVTGPLFDRQLGEQVHTILYIEDNLSNLRLIEHIMRKQPGVTLITAMQGQMGLDLACEHRPNLILLDLHLPDMMGSEVLRRLKEDPRTASIPVIVLSADANPRQVDKLLNANAQAYLTKPINVKELLKVVEETTGRESSIREK